MPIPGSRALEPDLREVSSGVGGSACSRYVGWLLLAVALLGSPGGAGGNGWEHGTVSFEALVAALESESAALRAQAAESLGFRGEARGTQPLLDLLGRPESSHRVRSAAYTALGRLADPEALPVLARCLRDEAREEIRGDCVAALGGLRSRESLDLVIEAFRTDAHDQVRGRAVDALGTLARPESVKLLSDLLAGGNPSLHRRAIAALGRTGRPEATPPLLARLRETEDVAEQAAILEALARLRDPSALNALLALLEGTSNQAIRTRIAIALGAIRAPSAYAALIGMLRDPLPAVQFYAVRGLRALGVPGAAGELSSLYGTLADDLAGRPSDALVADAPAVLAALDLQVEILRALAELDAPRGIGAFIDGARSPELPTDSQTALRIAEGFYERRRMALHGLGYSASREAVALLAGPDGLRHPDPRLRAAAVRSLAVLDAPESAGMLLPALRDPIPEVRWTAAMALGRLAHADAADPLIELLADEFGEVRRQAALALGYIAAPEASLPLARLVIDEPVASVRAAALYAMDLLDAAD